MTEQPTQAEPKQSLRERIFSRFRRSPRIDSGWDRMKRVGGLEPLMNIDDVESRRLELMDVLEQNQEDYENVFGPDKVKDLTPAKVRAYKMTVNNRVFSLFFTAGSPWYRGLDDRELADKVAKYLKIWNLVGDSISYVNDLFMCSMQLLNLSWKVIDVTNTPPYIIEAKTVINMTPERAKVSEVAQEL